MKIVSRLIALSAAMVTSMSASATEIRVMSGGAPKEVFAQLTPMFEQQTGNKVVFVYDVLTALREKIAAGEKADVLVMPVPMLDGYARDGKLRANTESTFGTVGISAVVKQGAPQPDISTKEKFREAMLSARSIVHATPGKTPSGTHMGKVMEQLGIADAVAKKVVHRPALEGGVQLVAEGQADIGIYPASEVANVKGVTIIGSLPGGIELNIVYGGAATADSAAGEAAAAFVRFMAAPENRSVWKHAGFDPPG
jgi:molybdate transport system substrate-binding protein